MTALSFINFQSLIYLIEHSDADFQAMNLETTSNVYDANLLLLLNMI